jgi:SulP family sulfate permease
MFSFLSFKKVQANWKAGLTVALISIPLSLSLAIASGATPLQGILTAVWAGIVYSFFAGSNYNVVGPAGALSGILALFVFSHGSAALPSLAVFTGIFILVAYFFRLERYLVFIPASALHGFTLGVALTIGLGQVNFALGLSGLPKHQKITENLMESMHHFGALSFFSLGMFVIFLAGMFLFARWTPKMPGAILLAPVGIVIGMLSSKGILPFSVQTLSSTYGDLSMHLAEFPRPMISMDIVVSAGSVAFVAILETLISAKIADGMAKTKNKHSRHKEMKALALANIASGLFGGIPATGVFARTALNVKTGATDATACFLQGLFVAFISVFLFGYFKYIPLAVIASILVFAAIRMVELHHYRRAFDFDRFGFWIMIFVAFVTVYEDPIAGILFGTAIASVLFVEKLSKGQFEMVFNHPLQRVMGTLAGDATQAVDEKHSVYKDCHTIVYSLKGQLAYLNAQAHIDRFEKKLTDYENVVLRFRELYFIDLDGVDAFDEIVEIVERQKKQVYISGASTVIEEMLHHSKYFDQLKKEGRIFDKTTDALCYLGYDKMTSERR